MYYCVFDMFWLASALFPSDLCEDPVYIKDCPIVFTAVVVVVIIEEVLTGGARVGENPPALTADPRYWFAWNWFEYVDKYDEPATDA